MEKSMDKMTTFEREKSIASTEHPVWSVLNKEKYIEGFYSKAEEMYDFIKSLVDICGNITKDGNTVPAMRQFFDMWNEYSSETFCILSSLVEPKE